MRNLGNDIRLDVPAKSGFEEAKIGRRIVKNAGKGAGAEIKETGRGQMQFGGVALQPFQSGHHCGKYPNEQDGDFLDRNE